MMSSLFKAILKFCTTNHLFTDLGLLEMMMWSKSAAGYNMRPSIILLLKSDEVVLNQPYCVQQVDWLIFLIYMEIN